MPTHLKLSLNMKITLFFLCLLASLYIKAGNTDSLDVCKYIFTYDYITYTEDAAGTPVVDSCQWGVMVGENYTKCSEYNNIMYDEVHNRDYSMQAFHCRKLNTPTIIIDRKNGTMTILDRIVPQMYIIKDKIPSIKWKMTESDTININGYSCKKASCTYAGRKWDVWYTEQIPVPAGPWKLCGLPGMILKAEDEGTHSFTFVGLQNVECKMKFGSRLEPQEINSSKFIQKRNKIYCNKQYAKNPRYYIPEDIINNAIEMSPGIGSKKEDSQTTITKDMIIPKKVNVYKPLELK